MDLDWEYRADSGKLGDWQLTPEGYLVAVAKIARIGVQEYPYLDSDGSTRIRREFRPPEEVANRDSLKTLCDLPISIEHPPVMLDSSNARQFAVGWNGSVSYDNGFVSTKLKLIDQQSVKNALDGERIELSVGYLTKLDWTPGIWQGQNYDAVQRQIKGNHIALTVKARGGSDLRLYPSASSELHKDSEILEKCWQISEPTWESDVRLDNLHVKVGGESNMKMHDEDQLKGMTKEDLVTLVVNLQKMWAEKEEELNETKDSAARLQGTIAAYEDNLSVNSDLHGKSDSDKVIDARVREKKIQITELEGRLDNAERDNAAFRREIDSAKAKIQRLDTELQLTREAQEKAIITQRQSWVKTWNEASPFLPKTAINDPELYKMDSYAIMRLALGNSKSGLNLDSLVEEATNPNDVIKTAFGVMIAEGVAKPSNERASVGQWIDQAKADSNNYPVDSIEKTQQEQKVKILNAWKGSN